MGQICMHAILLADGLKHIRDVSKLCEAGAQTAAKVLQSG